MTEKKPPPGELVIQLGSSAAKMRVLTPRQRKLIEARTQMFGQPKVERGDLEARRRRYAEAQRRIKIAVGRGEISRRDAERKLAEMRAKIFSDERRKSSRRER